MSKFPVYLPKNMINNLTDEELSQKSNYLAPIEAFARVTYGSLYVINYEKKGFDFVSDDNMFLFGHTPEKVKEMGYDFYFKYVHEDDLKLLLNINTIGFDFLNKTPIDERLSYTISYDIHFKNNEGEIILVNHKITPIYITNDGSIWKAICLISLSEMKKSGNIKIFKKDADVEYVYDLKNSIWKEEERTILSDREKEILIYSARGYTISQIAEAIFISTDTIKYHRKKIIKKLKVSNISEAIFFTINNKLY